MPHPRSASSRAKHELHDGGWGSKLSAVAVTLIALMVALAPHPAPPVLRAFALLALLVHPLLLRALGEGREWARLVVGELQVLSWTVMAFAIAAAALGRGSGALAIALWMAVAVVSCFPKPLLGTAARQRFDEARAERSELS